VSASVVVVWRRLAVPSLVCHGEPKQAAQGLAAASASCGQRAGVRRGELWPLSLLRSCVNHSVGGIEEPVYKVPSLSNHGRQDVIH